jgi:nifR3 family TIM-barrel protein
VIETAAVAARDPGRPPPLALGPLTIAPPVILAPMSGLTTLPTRALAERAGCGLTVTEFLAAPALVAGVASELAKLQPSPGGRPFGAQIFGREPQLMARAARICVAHGAALVDVNMGCPARRVTRGAAGAALMREPELSALIVRAVVLAVDGRALTTVKIRSGWDERTKNAPEFAARMVEAGAQAIAIHGRTRTQGFAGEVELDIIARVKRAVGVPVIGNGDVADVACLERMFAATGCDAVMIGRAALGNPWLFAAARAWWRGEPAPPAPTPADRLREYREHLELHVAGAGGEDASHAVLEMRKFAGWYLRGFPGAAQLRKAIYALGTREEVLELTRTTTL